MRVSKKNIERVEEAMAAMKRALAVARERMGEGLQLTRTQLEILVMLAKQQPQTTRDLAKRLFLTQSAVTQTIDTLVRRGLVERQDDEQDRRVIWLKLTTPGTAVTDQICRLRNQKIHALLAKLTDEETEVLLTLTKKLTEVFEESNTIQTENLRG